MYLSFSNNPEHKIIKSSDDVEKLIDILDLNLRTPLKNNFGAPLSRRVDCIVPFIPFNQEECFVIADMIIRTFISDCGMPQDDPDDLKITNVKINVADSVADFLSSFYDVDAGASSMKKAAESKVFDKVSFAYFLPY